MAAVDNATFEDPLPAIEEEKFFERLISVGYYDSYLRNYLFEMLIKELQSIMDLLKKSEAIVFQCEDNERRFIPRWRISTQNEDCQVIVDCRNKGRTLAAPLPSDETTEAKRKRVSDAQEDVLITHETVGGSTPSHITSNSVDVAKLTEVDFHGNVTDKIADIRSESEQPNITISNDMSRLNEFRNQVPPSKGKRGRPRKFKARQNLPLTRHEVPNFNRNNMDRSGHYSSGFNSSVTHPEFGIQRMTRPHQSTNDQLNYCYGGGSGVSGDFNQQNQNNTSFNPYVQAYGTSPIFNESRNYVESNAAHFNKDYVIQNNDCNNRTFYL